MTFEDFKISVASLPNAAELIAQFAALENRAIDAETRLDRITPTTSRVIFEHDDALQKWGVIVTKVKDDTEARQAFTAVLLTMGMVHPRLQLEHAKVKPHDEGFEIEPAV